MKRGLLIAGITLCLVFFFLSYINLDTKSGVTGFFSFSRGMDSTVTLRNKNYINSRENVIAKKSSIFALTNAPISGKFSFFSTSIRTKVPIGSWRSKFQEALNFDLRSSNSVLNTLMMFSSSRPSTNVGPVCTPNLKNKFGHKAECGDDGCGNSRGTCSIWETCDGGECISKLVVFNTQRYVEQEEAENYKAEVIVTENYKTEVISKKSGYRCIETPSNNVFRSASKNLNTGDIDICGIAYWYVRLNKPIPISLSGCNLNTGKCLTLFDKTLRNDYDSIECANSGDHVLGVLKLFNPNNPEDPKVKSIPLENCYNGCDRASKSCVLPNCKPTTTHSCNTKDYYDELIKTTKSGDCTSNTEIQDYCLWGCKDGEILCEDFTGPREKVLCEKRYDELHERWDQYEIKVLIKWPEAPEIEEDKCSLSQTCNPGQGCVSDDLPPLNSDITVDDGDPSAVREALISPQGERTSAEAGTNLYPYENIDWNKLCPLDSGDLRTWCGSELFADVNDNSLYLSCGTVYKGLFSNKVYAFFDDYTKVDCPSSKQCVSNSFGSAQCGQVPIDDAGFQPYYECDANGNSLYYTSEGVSTLIDCQGSGCHDAGDEKGTCKGCDEEIYDSIDGVCAYTENYGVWEISYPISELENPTFGCKGNILMAKTGRDSWSERGLCPTFCDLTEGTPHCFDSSNSIPESCDISRGAGDSLITGERNQIRNLNYMEYYQYLFSCKEQYKVRDHSWEVPYESGCFGSILGNGLQNGMITYECDSNNNKCLRNEVYCQIGKAAPFGFGGCDDGRCILPPSLGSSGDSCSLDSPCGTNLVCISSINSDGDGHVALIDDTADLGDGVSGTCGRIDLEKHEPAWCEVPGPMNENNPIEYFPGATRCNLDYNCDGSLDICLGNTECIIDNQCGATVVPTSEGQASVEQKKIKTLDATTTVAVQNDFEDIFELIVLYENFLYTKTIRNGNVIARDIQRCYGNICDLSTLS